jgi:hypothetical protein
LFFQCISLDIILLLVRMQKNAKDLTTVEARRNHWVMQQTNKFKSCGNQPPRQCSVTFHAFCSFMPFVVFSHSTLGLVYITKRRWQRQNGFHFSCFLAIFIHSRGNQMTHCDCLYEGTQGMRNWYLLSTAS